MLVENTKNATDGTSALAPQINPIPKEREKSPAKQSPAREALKQTRRLKVLKFLKLNSYILAGGLVGVILVSRYSVIYKNQKEIITLQDNISVIKEESENLSIKLLGFNNIAYIEEVATKELKMIKPKTVDAVYCDLNAIQPIAVENSEDGKGDRLISRIKKIFFN
ncbi:MAG: hypothetical protein RR891_12530 [Clostridium sp.]|uniref:hypothetical protein n=1 Tax=Clostridium sp. TaxID=1506 RepID=UPI003031F7FA